MPCREKKSSADASNEMMRATILAILVLRFAASSALAPDPHVDAVTRIVEGAKGKVEKTADGQSLKLVDLAVPGALLEIDLTSHLAFALRGAANAAWFDSGLSTAGTVTGGLAIY